MQYQTFNKNVRGLKFTFTLADSYWADTPEDEPLVVEILDGEQVVSSYFITTMLSHEPNCGLTLDRGVPEWHLTSAQFGELRAFLVMSLNAKGYSVEEYWSKYAEEYDKQTKTLYV